LEWLGEDISWKKDSVLYSSVIIETNEHLSQLLFESCFEFWHSKNHQIAQALSNCIFLFITSLVRNQNDIVPKCFEKIFQIIKNETSILWHSQLHPSIWVLFLNDFKQWLGTAGLKTYTFWPQYVSTYFNIAKRREFSQFIKENSLITSLYERFLFGFWKSPSNEGIFIVNEKTFQVCHLLIEAFPKAPQTYLKILFKHFLRHWNHFLIFQ
jgi:hypothetical protein